MPAGLCRFYLNIFTKNNFHLLSPAVFYALVFFCNHVTYFQNARSKQALALVPERNAASDVSGESDSDTEEGHLYRRQSTSEEPSIDSSLERLNIIDSPDVSQAIYIPPSDDDCSSTTSPDEERNLSPSLLTNEQPLNCTLPSLPTMSPMSNIPSVTASFILDQVCVSPNQSPQISASTLQPTHDTGVDRRRRQNPQN